MPKKTGRTDPESEETETKAAPSARLSGQTNGQCFTAVNTFTFQSLLSFFKLFIYSPGQVLCTEFRLHALALLTTCSVPERPVRTVIPQKTAFFCKFDTIQIDPVLSCFFLFFLNFSPESWFLKIKKGAFSDYTFVCFCAKLAKSEKKNKKKQNI